ncbi:MAG: hypothetical protein AAGA71_12840 [Pseudomonadota bacterium]
MTKDPFDFSDLSDLPEELQKKLNTETQDRASEFAAVVIKGAEAGHDQLTINHIIAAATRMGMDIPSQQTVRGYLNKAVDMGLISKPTRQTYGLPSKRSRKEDAGLEGDGDAVVTSEVEAPVDEPVVAETITEANAAEPVELQAKTDNTDPLADL